MMRRGWVLLIAVAVAYCTGLLTGRLLWYDPRPGLRALDRALEELFSPPAPPARR